MARGGWGWVPATEDDERRERSGEMRQGLMRVGGGTQDDESESETCGILWLWLSQEKVAFAQFGST
jgi:hypothetical protein